MPSAEQVPYDGWAAPQVIVAVAHRGDRLPLPPPRRCSPFGVGNSEEEGAGGDEEGGDCPAAFLDLVDCCWAQDPKERPAFAAIEAALAAMPPA